MNSFNFDNQLSIIPEVRESIYSTKCQDYFKTEQESPKEKDNDNSVKEKQYEEFRDSKDKDNIVFKQKAISMNEEKVKDEWVYMDIDRSEVVVHTKDFEIIKNFLLD